MKINWFPIVYDEAQAHTTYFIESFSSSDNTKAMLFFSIVFKTFLQFRLSMTELVIYFYPCGTGLSMKVEEDLTQSSIAKTELK